jgi:hypothetical protein
MKNKYINQFKDFLFEQDLAAMGVPPTPAAPTPKTIKYDFLFMTGSDDAGNGRRKYPDGSIVIEYPCYSATADELEEWAKNNVIDSNKNKLNSSELEVRRKSIVDIVKGDRVNISPEDLPFIEKLKNAAATNILGSVLPDTTVVFSDDTPTTDNINVTFIKYKK